MPISLRKESDGQIVIVNASGKLTAEDYESFLPSIEKLIESRHQIRILLELKDFHGWELAAGWEDFKFGIRHYRDLERLAIVGDRKWEQWMAQLFKLFTTGELRYFDQSESDAALEWIKEGVLSK